jgi:hypothetical protein
MKKIWFLALFTIITLFNSSAQKLRFGVFVDPLISYLRTDVSKIEPDGGRLGVNFGLMMDNFFAEHYAFSSGISLRTMGGTLNYIQGKNEFHTNSDTITMLPHNTSVKYKLQYLHIPIALKLRTTEIGYFTYYADLGLDPMVNVKASADINSLGEKNIGVGDEIRPFYMAYHIGAGFEYKIVGNTALVIGVTYMNGFSDITSNVGNSAEKTVMHSFELRVGVIF